MIAGHPSEVGSSDDPDIHCSIVSTPVCGHVGDTVILREPDGSIRDAVSYGVSVPSSTRYSEAVAAGELGDGTFVSVSDQFEQLTIGRDRNSLDSNTIDDWRPNGGANALAGSPFARNVTLPNTEGVWAFFFQSFLSTVVSQEVYGLSVVTGGVDNFINSGVTSTLDHSMDFSGGVFGAGVFSLSGTVANSLSALGGGRYAMESAGVLTGSSRSVDFTVRREVGGAESVTAVEAVVSIGATSYPYSMTMTRTFSGVRGDFDVTYVRDLTQWSNVTKTTNASQSVDWLVAANGTVLSTTSTAVASRPWPLSDGPADGGSAPPIVATETLYLDTTAVPTPAGFEISWTKMEMHYDNGMPNMVGSGVQAATVAPDPTVGATESVLAGDFLFDGGAFAVTRDLSAVAGQKLVHETTELSLVNQVKYTTDVTFDPPNYDGGFWSKLKSAVKFTAKAIATGATCVAAGVGCVATSAAGCAAGGITSTASLGTASLGGLAIASGGVGACYGIGYGASIVLDEIWE